MKSLHRTLKVSVSLSLYTLGLVVFAAPASAAPPLPPTNVLALNSTQSGVFVSWSGSDGATFYTVWRWDTSGNYTFLGEPSPPAATSYLDKTAASGKGYIYQVKAHNAQGESSPLSVGDIATTVVYTDPNLTAGMLIKAAHLRELREVGDIMHALAGFGTIPQYTDPVIVAGSTTAKAVHFVQVEDVLIEARNTLGLSTPASLGIAPGVVIRASHVLAMRSYAE